MITPRGGWDTSGPEPVAGGIHRIPLPLPGDGLRAVNVYAIKDGNGVVLIDAGPSREAALRAVDRGLASFGAGRADVTTVLATHGHYDHYGLVSTGTTTTTAWCRRSATHPMRRWGSASASADSSRSSPSRRSTVDRAPPSLADGSRGGPLAAATEAQERGRQHPSPRGTRWREPDRSLRDGEDIVLERRTLRVCWTPGHTRGHIVFHDRANGLLFAGGHVLPDITPSLGLEPSPDGRALEQFLRPLRAARELVVDLVLPGHGAALRWTRRGRRFCELDTFNRMLAVGETVTHLELLVRDGRLRRDAARGRIVYALAP